MVTIFLDVDGVLNCDSTKERCMGFLGIEPRFVQNLKYIVDMTNAQIVLTTTWKYGWEPVNKNLNDEWADYLDRALQEEGLEAIAKTEDDGYCRGAGIADWLAKNPAEAWVVLDDNFFRDFGKYEIQEHLVLTEFDEGLTKELAEQAVNMIQEQLQEVKL